MSEIPIGLVRCNRREVSGNLAKQTGFFIFVLFLASPGQVRAQGGKFSGGELMQIFSGMIRIDMRRWSGSCGSRTCRFRRCFSFLRAEQILCSPAERTDPGVGKIGKSSAF